MLADPADDPALFGGAAVSTMFTFTRGKTASLQTWWK
jgi:hypothetical protein